MPILNTNLKNIAKFGDLDPFAGSNGGYQHSNFGQKDEPSGFDKITTTIQPGAAFDLPDNKNLSGSSMNDFDDDELRIIVSDHRLIRCDLSDKTCGTHAASRCIILHIGEDCGDGS